MDLGDPRGSGDRALHGGVGGLSGRDGAIQPQHRAAAAATGGPAQTSAPQSPAPQSPDDIADALLQQFTTVRDHHARLGQALAEVASHDEDELVLSDSPNHPANLICELCRLFYGLLTSKLTANLQAMDG